MHSAWVARYARIALGVAFLSAVSSRFGWGGTFAGFESYTAEVLSFMPASTIPFFARAATVFELGFGIALVLGIGLRWVTFGAAGLLLVFAVSMAISSGIKEPLDYSVFSASACALLLAQQEHRKKSAVVGQLGREHNVVAITADADRRRAVG